MLIELIEPFPLNGPSAVPALPESTCIRGISKREPYYVEGQKEPEVGLMKIVMPRGGVKDEAKAAVGVPKVGGTGTARGDSVAVGGTGG